MYLTNGSNLNLSFEESLHYAADHPNDILKRNSPRVRSTNKPLEKNLQNGPHFSTKKLAHICNKCTYLKSQLLDDTESYLISCELMQTNWIESWETEDLITPQHCPYLE